MSLTKVFLSYTKHAMESKINYNNSDAYETAITQWLVKHLRENDIKETHFSREARLGKNETDARTFRKLKEGKRHWSIVDLCKVADYFDDTPSSILSKVEQFYHEEGIVHPEKAGDTIIGMGLTQDINTPHLISTWKKKGKAFVLVDCDPDWKKVTKGEINKIIGMASKEIFPAYPEVTVALEKAWREQSNVSMTLWYDIKTELAQKILQSEPRKRLLAVDAMFVPPDSIVAYVKDITSDETSGSEN